MGYYERFKELNINLSEKTEVVPHDIMEIGMICNYYDNFLNILYSNKFDDNRFLLINTFNDVYGEIYIHLAYHFKSLKKPFGSLIKELKKEFGRHVLSKSTSISKLFDIEIIGGQEIFSKAFHSYEEFDEAITDKRHFKFDGDIKIRLFQSGEKLVGDDRVVMFFKGKEWESYFLVKIDENPNEISRVFRTPLGLNPEEVRDKLIELVKKYRMALIRYWNTPSMSIDELKKLIIEIDSGEKG